MTHTLDKYSDFSTTFSFLNDKILLQFQQLAPTLTKVLKLIGSPMLEPGEPAAISSNYVWR